MSKARSGKGKGGGGAKGVEGGLPGLTRRQRRRLAWATGGLAVVLLGVGGGWWYGQTRPAPGEYRENQGNAHIPTADTPHTAYNSEPPTSGPHLPYIAPWGYHDRPIPKELQVHNLEDGGVVVSYKPECGDQVLASLKALTGRYADHVILAPYPGLDRCIALTAWTRIDKLDTVDERRITRFIDAYRGIDHHAR